MQHGERRAGMDSSPWGLGQEDLMMSILPLRGSTLGTGEKQDGLQISAVLTGLSESASSGSLLFIGSN